MLAVNRLSTEVTHIREFLRIQCGTWNEQLEVRPESGNVLQQAKQNVCVQGSLMGFINDDNTIALEDTKIVNNTLHYLLDKVHSALQVTL